MKKKLFVITHLFILTFVIICKTYPSTDKPAYKLYNDSGEAVTYMSMLSSLLEADIILFGELHNNTISHWLQLELTIDLHSVDSNSLILGGEMFERDGQLILNEYFEKFIRERDYETGTRLWPNYKTDYKPLVTYAVNNGIPFIATNIPRRYASIVFRGGFEALDSLSDEAKKYIAPLPIPYDPELPGYKAMLEMKGDQPMHANPNFPKSQAIKDATMAWFISENFYEGKRFLHFNGSYHSDNYEGIVWYLDQYNPQLKVMTITTIEQEDVSTMDDTAIGKADFIIVANKNVTKTY